MRRVRKLVGTVLGGITAGAVVLGFRLFGVEIEPELAAAIVVILGAVGTYVAPPNSP